MKKTENKKAGNPDVPPVECRQTAMIRWELLFNTDMTRE